MAQDNTVQRILAGAARLARASPVHQTPELNISPQELRQLAGTFLKRRKNNPVLIRDHGVGTTSILNSLAHHSSLWDYRLLSLDFETLASYHGENFENLVRAILEELKTRNDKIILVVDTDSDYALSAVFNGFGGISLTSMLKVGRPRCILVTTQDQYRNYVENRSLFHGYFGDEL